MRKEKQVFLRKNMHEVMLVRQELMFVASFECQAKEFGTHTFP